MPNYANSTQFQQYPCLVIIIMINLIPKFTRQSKTQALSYFGKLVQKTSTYQSYSYLSFSKAAGPTPLPYLWLTFVKCLLLSAF